MALRVGLVRRFAVWLLVVGVPPYDINLARVSSPLVGLLSVLLLADAGRRFFIKKVCATCVQ